MLAAVLLRLRNRRYRRIAAEEQVDVDADGIPDVYEAPEDIGPAPLGAAPSAVRRQLTFLVADALRTDVPSWHTREEVVRNLLSYRTREVAVR